MSSDDRFSNHIVIFQTGKLWEFDMARDALQKRGVPFFAQTDNLSGVRTAIDATPIQAPGTFWNLLVPKESVHEAEEILISCRLDVQKKPLIWDFAPGPQGKKLWLWYSKGALVMIVLFLITWAILTFR